MVTKVLYIEDDPQQLEIVRLFVAKEDVQLLTASTGSSGLEIAKAEEPAIVIIDINLPVMNGIEVAQSLRALPKFAATPLIALTSNMKTGIMREHIGTLFDAYLPKPIMRRDFLDCLHRLLDPKQAPPSTAPQTTKKPVSEQN